MACRGGGTATRTMVSALSPAAEAALRWAEVWLPWFSCLERRDRKPFFLRERSESRVEKGWHGGSAAGQLWESPLLPPVPVPQSLATGRPGGPRSLGTLQNLALSISEQGMLRVFVSVPPLLRDPVYPVPRFDPQIALKKDSEDERSAESRSELSPVPVIRHLAFFQAIGKEIGVLSTPKRSLKKEMYVDCCVTF